MLGYKKADGMKPLQKLDGKWVGWCTHCGCIMTLQSPDDVKQLFSQKRKVSNF